VKAFRICILIAAILGATSCTSVQESPEATEKESPQAKAPESPPATETVTFGGKTITINYSSPRVRGREGQLFGPDGRIGQDPNYPVWRAGANSATALHTDADLDIGGLEVPAGDYTLYVNLADPNNWELIINKQTGQWGLEYDMAQDLGRVKMTMSQPPAPVENLKYTLSDAGSNGGTLTLEWENHSASVPFTVKG
jgi:Protein of unknown function (DUF2911)